MLQHFLDFVLKGKGFTLEKLHSNITGSCAIFEVNKYIYKNLNIEGFVENKIFNGSLAVSDENLKMDFKGNFCFHIIYIII